MAVTEPQFSASAASNIIATAPYAQTWFSEPIRLAIPPPHIDYVSGEPVLGSFAVHQAKSQNYGSSEYGDTAFLQSLRSACNIVFGHSMLSWEYNMRRTAQPILPFLLLGPSTAARDINYIRNTGITMLISVRSAIAAKAAPKYLDASTFESAEGLETLTLDLASPYDLITRLSETLKAMNDHLQKNCPNTLPENVEDIYGKILIFCESGNERSTALVAAYLMVLFGVDTVNAMQIIQSQRFCIAPDDGMKNMLTNFEDILKAKREVAVQRGTRNASTASKRSVDNMYGDGDGNGNGNGNGDSDEMRDENTSEEDGPRKNWAPFQAT